MTRRTPFARPESDHVCKAASGPLCLFALLPVAQERRCYANDASCRVTTLGGGTRDLKKVRRTGEGAQPDLSTITLPGRGVPGDRCPAANGHSTWPSPDRRWYDVPVRRRRRRALRAARH